MAFCPKCGKPFEENASNCAYCGAKNPAAPAAAANNTVNEIVNKAKSLNKKNIAILAGAAVAVILVIVLISSLLGGGGYKKAIDNYIGFVYEGDIDNLENLVPEKFWEELEDEYDIKLKDIKDEVEEDMDFALELLEEEYGKKIKVKYNIVEKEALDEDDLDEIKDALKENYGISKKSVKKAFEVELEYTIKGKEDEDEDDMDLVVVKIDSKWYVTSSFSNIKNYAY